MVSFWLTGGGLESKHPGRTAAGREAASVSISDTWLSTLAAQESHLWSLERGTLLHSDAIDKGIHLGGTKALQESLTFGEVWEPLA